MKMKGNEGLLRSEWAMREAPQNLGTSYWFAKNDYTLVEVPWQDDVFDREAIKSLRAFATREEGLLGLGLACESNDN